MYRPGDYLAICDICGFQRLSSECRMNWKNQFVCSDTCYEPKHPQFTPPKPLHEKQTVPVHRPEPDYNFITTPITGDDL